MTWLFYFQYYIHINFITFILTVILIVICCIWIKQFSEYARWKGVLDVFEQHRSLPTFRKKVIKEARSEKSNLDPNSNPVNRNTKRTRDEMEKQSSDSGDSTPVPLQMTYSWNWSKGESTDKTDPASSATKEKEQASSPSEEQKMETVRKPCQFFRKHILSLGESCRYGLGCRNSHSFADVLLDLKERYKKWQPWGKLVPLTESNALAPATKRIKLDQSEEMQKPLLVSSMIEELREQPFDEEYANFLNAKSPVHKILEIMGWTKGGLGKEDRRGKRT